MNEIDDQSGPDAGQGGGPEPRTAGRGTDGSAALPAIRVVMMPRDTNPQGTIFGGVLLSLIDQAAFVEALRHGAHRWVTVAFEGVEFHRPVLVGDVLSLWSTTTRVGRTSVRVHVDVRAQRAAEPVEVAVTQADVVLVATGAGGEPVPVAGTP